MRLFIPYSSLYSTHLDMKVYYCMAKLGDWVEWSKLLKVGRAVLCAGYRKFAEPTVVWLLSPCCSVSHIDRGRFLPCRHRQRVFNCRTVSTYRYNVSVTLYACVRTGA
jgi:hypothetical protein